MTAAQLKEFKEACLTADLMFPWLDAACRAANEGRDADAFEFLTRVGEVAFDYSKTLMDRKEGRTPDADAVQMEPVYNALDDAALVGSPVVWHRSDCAEHYNSACEAFLDVCSLCRKFTEECTPSDCARFLDYTGITATFVSGLRVGMTRERAKLVGETAPVAEPRPRKKRSADEQIPDERIARAFVKHHDYRDGGVGNYKPAKLADIATVAGLLNEKGEPNKMAVTRFLKIYFGKKDAYVKYRGACTRKLIGEKLFDWNGDLSKSYHKSLTGDDRAGQTPSEN